METEGCNHTVKDVLLIGMFGIYASSLGSPTVELVFHSLERANVEVLDQHGGICAVPGFWISIPGRKSDVQGAF